MVRFLEGSGAPAVGIWKIWIIELKQEERTVGLLSTGHAYTVSTLNQQRLNPTIQCTFPFGIVSKCIQKIGWAMSILPK